MNVWKPVELALTGGARLAWPAFQAINRRFEGAVVPAEVGAGAAAEEPRAHQSPRSAGRARPTRSVRPACARRARGSSPASSRSSRSINEHVGEIKAHILERDGKVIIEKTCPIHGTFTDTLAINPAFLRAARVAVSRPRFRRGHRPPAQPRHVVDQARPRRGADDRPDQPLQHDVRPVLHGRQPGRLRPRADARRGQAAARRRGQHQAAAADDGAVLGRRADDLADLPRRRPLRAQGRLLQRPGGDQRHPLRAGAGVRARRRARPACASPTCSSTASPRRPTRTARSATCST